MPLQLTKEFDSFSTFEDGKRRVQESIERQEIQEEYQKCRSQVCYHLRKLYYCRYYQWLNAFVDRTWRS